VLEPCGARALLLARDAGDRLVEADVRILPVEDPDEMIAKRARRLMHGQ
jgi:hypothetical protein